MARETRHARAWWRRAQHVLALALALGFLGGLARVAVHAAATDGWRFPWLLLDLSIVRVNHSALLLLGGLLLYLVCLLALRRGTGRPLASSLLATGLLALPLLVPLAVRINRDHLPGKFEPVSIAANLGLAAGALLACGLAAWLLLGWASRRILEPPARGPRALWVLAAGLLALNAASLLPRPATAPPNVVILLIDVLRADRLGAYGYERPTSPHIDAFAQDSVLFTHAISQSSFTKTSVASLFSGLDPQHHGVYRGNLQDTRDQVTSDVLPPAVSTLAERAAAAGLYTVAWITNPHLAAYMGFGQGFRDYREPRDRRISNIVEGFLAWARGARHQPFLAYVHFIDLHDPYRPEPPFDTLYGVHSDLSEPLRPKRWKAFRDAVNEGEVELSPADVEQLNALHDGLLTSMDREIGRLLDGLRDLGLYDDSLIILTSDHGDGFMEHGFISHSQTPYDELVRVPLIMKLPDSRHAGLRVESQVRLIDVAPTVGELTGAPTQGLDGASLLRQMEAADTRPAFSWVTNEQGKILSIRTQDRKFILFPDGTHELYDLERDPGEQVNVAPRRPEETARFLEAARTALEESETHQPERILVDPDSVEQLRALGYVD